MPDVPTAIEAGIHDFEAQFANILLVPARTPDAVRRHLAAEISRVLQLPDVRARFAALATEPLGDSGQDAAARIAREHARWGKVVKDANIKLPQ